VTFDDFRNIVLILWAVYLPVTIVKEALSFRGPAKVSVPDLEKILLAWDLRHREISAALAEKANGPDLERRIKEIDAAITALERTESSNQRTIGRLETNDNNFQEWERRMELSLENRRKEMDAKLSTLHRRLDALTQNQNLPKP